jgi:putative transcriptional regulator
LDALKKNQKTSSFRDQMAHSMAELQTIMQSGASPSNDGRLTLRTIEVDEPSDYRAKDVKRVREELNVSQAVFAQLVGVSDVLVRSWERGAREPAPIARRLLDQIRAYPDRFAKLVHPFGHGETSVPPRRLTHGPKRAR